MIVRYINVHLIIKLNVAGNSCKSTFVLKRKADILSISYDISIHQ